MKHNFLNTYTFIGLFLFTSGIVATYLFKIESYGFLRGACLGAGIALVFNGFFLKKN